MKEGPSILFRCDSSREIGFGHLMRCLALADEFRYNHGCRVTFAMQQDPAGMTTVRDCGYPVLGTIYEKLSFEQESSWISEVADRICAKALVLDVRDNLSRTAVQALRDKGILIVVLDDPSERRLAADMAFYPPVPQLQDMDWTGFTGRFFAGWEWVVMRREFTQGTNRVPHKHPLLLVTMGGSDPAGLTLKAIDALNMLDEDFDTIVVLGPGFCHDKELETLLTKKTHRHFEIRANVKDMPSLMAKTDLAVASFGVTAYELAAMGVPAIHLCLTEDHATSASALMKAGIAMSLGIWQEVTPEFLAFSVRSMLLDSELLARMSRQARALIDGRGVVRMANRIVKEMRDKNA